MAEQTYRMIVVTKTGRTLKSNPWPMDDEELKQANELLDEIANLNRISFDWGSGRLAIPAINVDYVALLTYDPEDDD